MTFLVLFIFRSVFGLGFFWYAWNWIGVVGVGWTLIDSSNSSPPLSDRVMIPVGVILRSWSLEMTRLL